MIVRSSRAAVAAWFLLVLSAAAVHAQDPRLAQRLDAGTAAAVTVLVDSAGMLLLPTEPVVQKALEGASKSASADRIISAVRALVADMVTARAALGTGVSDDALVLAATALDAGVSRDGLQRLRPHSRERAFGGALAGVVYLLSRGVPAYESVDLVDAMLRAGLSRAEFLSLQRLVEQDLRAGVSAAEAASVRARALIRHGARLGPGGSGIS